MNPTLVYDGDCAMCQRAVAWIQKRDRAAAFDYLPCQAEERPLRFPGLSLQQCMEAIQLVMPDQTIHSGDAAVAHILERLPGWTWLVRSLRLPLVRSISPSAYGFIARHRYAISALLRKKDSTATHCGLDGPCE